MRIRASDLKLRAQRKDSERMNLAVDDVFEMLEMRDLIFLPLDRAAVSKLSPASHQATQTSKHPRMAEPRPGRGGQYFW